MRLPTVLGSPATCGHIATGDPRVTVEGRLLLCLGNEHSMDLRKILRSENFSEAALQEAIVAAMDLKPERHYFYEKDHAQPVRLMNMTGG